MKLLGFDRQVLGRRTLSEVHVDNQKSAPTILRAASPFLHSFDGASLNNVRNLLFNNGPSHSDWKDGLVRSVSVDKVDFQSSLP